MTTLKPNDPKLTAFALGELSGDEAAQIAQQIERDHTLQSEVEAIRETAELISGELAAEPILSLTTEQRNRIADGPPPVLNQPWIFGARTMWAGAGLAAAACLIFAVVLTINSQRADQQYPIAINAPGQSNFVLSDEELRRAQESAQRAFGVKKQDDGKSPPAPKLAREEALPPSLSPLGPPLRYSGSPQQSGMIEVSEAENAKRMNEFESSDVIQNPGGSLMTESQMGAPPPPSLPESSGRQSRKREVSSNIAIPNAIATRELELDGVASNVGGIGLGKEVDEDFNREEYNAIVENEFVPAIEQQLSTFSIDVDTASYSNMRRFLNQGQLPPRDAVRIEEMLNYFTYSSYESPTGDVPFSSNVEIASAPWKPEHRLVRIALKGKEVRADTRPATSLVFLLDVSGSMKSNDKLPLVKESMKMLVNELHADDRLGIVTYAGSSGVLLDSIYCSAENKNKIMSAIDSLGARGSTHGSAGIQDAYNLSTTHFIEGGVNRVILCTDGDFNVGVSSEGALIQLIEEKRKTGVFLSVLGFGTGNLQDAKMEQLADHGNGMFAYIDSHREAKKVLVDQMGGTLVTIAKDVKIQVDFNPARVGAYRLIGYENRALAARDFTDDTKDAGEIGAGHTVTALYEIIPPDDAIALADGPKSDFVEQGTVVASDLIMKLKLRYKEPDGETSTELIFPIKDDGDSFENASIDFTFASAVASFGMILRDSPYKGDSSFDSVLEMASGALGDDPNGQRAEFVELVQRAKAISGQ